MSEAAFISGPVIKVKQYVDPSTLIGSVKVSSEMGDVTISDGFHTFEELYDHRITLFIALCKALRQPYAPEIWRSKVNGDGGIWEGLFIMGIFKEPGKQITYHLPLSRWEETDFAETLDQAPDFDGHSSYDVLERLKQL